MRRSWRGVRAFDVSCALMLLVQLAVPMLQRAGAENGYALELYLPGWEHEIRAMLMLILTAAALRLRKEAGGFGRVCAAFCLPTALVCGFFSLIPLNHAQARISGAQDTMCILGECGLAACVFFRCAGRSKLKLMMGILSGLAAPIAAMFLFFSLVMADFGAVYISEAVTSPDGSEQAYLICRDEGALGGSQCLEIRESGEGIHVLIGRLIRRECIGLDTSQYPPYWAEGAFAEVRWLNGHALTVGGVPVRREPPDL